MPQQLTQHQLAHFKQRLTAEKVRIEADYARYVSDDRDGAKDDQASEVSHSDANDPADEATNLMDRERSIAAEDNMGRILAKITRAMEKIEDGTYGLSDVDGAPIPLERLEALPYALTTVDQEDQI